MCSGASLVGILLGSCTDAAKGAPEAALGATTADGSRVSQVAFGNADPQVVRIVNMGDANSAPLTISIQHDTAGAFAIDPASTCPGRALAPNEQCSVTLVDHSTSPDTVTAMLVTDGGGLGSFTVTLVHQRGVPGGGGTGW